LDFGSRSDYREVPDPYHGGKDDFDLVLDLVEDAALGLLHHIRTKSFR
jgi:protein-tyrosine phosphatase